MESRNPPPTNITLPHQWVEEKEELKCRKCGLKLKNDFWLVCWDCYVASIKVTYGEEGEPSPPKKKPEPVRVKLKTVKGTVKSG
ncbi:MAG: hypothetical protein ACWGQW_02885 [bacterium]